MGPCIPSEGVTSSVRSPETSRPQPIPRHPGKAQRKLAAGLPGGVFQHPRVAVPGPTEEVGDRPQAGPQQAQFFGVWGAGLPPRPGAEDGRIGVGIGHLEAPPPRRLQVVPVEGGVTPEVDGDCPNLAVDRPRTGRRPGEARLYQSSTRIDPMTPPFLASTMAYRGPPGGRSHRTSIVSPSPTLPADLAVEAHRRPGRSHGLAPASRRSCQKSQRCDPRRHPGRWSSTPASRTLTGIGGSHPGTTKSMA